MDTVELKAAARNQIKGNIGILFIITVIMALVSVAAAFVLTYLIPGGWTLAPVIVLPAFSLSMTRIYLDIAEEYKIQLSDAFSGFDDFWSAFKVTFLMGFFTFLWSLLLIVPGIIKAISYSMAPYILARDKGKPAMECIRESKAMTEGHKAEIFTLCLSFLGWILLCLVTFGIAAIWVLPYMQATFTNVYNTLKPEKRPKKFDD